MRANQSLSTPTGRKSSSFITILKALGLGEATGELDRHTSDLSLKYTWRFTLKYNMYFTVTDQLSRYCVRVQQWNINPRRVQRA